MHSEYADEKCHMQSALLSLILLLLWSRNGTPDARSLAHRRQSREHFLISGLGRTISPKNFMYLAAQGEGARSRAARVALGRLPTLTIWEPQARVPLAPSSSIIPDQKFMPAAGRDIHECESLG